MIKMIAFDADDTLWHNETLYAVTAERLAQLLAAYRDVETIQQELYETEMRNLKLFGYGIKSYTLSMIETAIELTDGQICGRDIQTIIEAGKLMLKAPVRLLDHVEGVLAQLSKSYRLMLITKGDLFDQESKIARSGLANYFEAIEIVSDKSPETYRNLLEKFDLAAEDFLMVGNSLRSDILPVLNIGGQAVYIPYHITWAHEVVSQETAEQYGYHELEHIGQLPQFVMSQG